MVKCQCISSFCLDQEATKAGNFDSTHQVQAETDSQNQSLTKRISAYFLNTKIDKINLVLYRSGFFLQVTKANKYFEVWKISMPNPLVS